MTVTFDKRKKDFLSKVDKSSIGGWDKPIISLCNKLNKSKDYFSLSSCSGRFVLIKNIIEKKPGLFVYRTHELGKFDAIREELEKYNGEEGLVFKQEPCILHVACRDLNKAKELLIKAQENGWKQSGIIAISSNRVVVDLRSTEGISFPIHDGKNILVDDDFIRFIIKEGNQRLKRTWDKIKRLERVV